MVQKQEIYSDKDSLKRGMKARHLSMIAVGGTIGSGLFVGVGKILNQAGPLGSLVAFIVGGFIMLLALLSLAEMAVAIPISGSFQAYATRFISPLMGSITGWLYWINWGTAAAMSLTAAAMIMANWLPTIPEWIWCLIFLGILAISNVCSVKVYGETEFWFAGIKVLAIIIFILIGGFLILFGPKEHIIGFKAFYQSGFFPVGGIAIIFVMVNVATSFQGAELVGIAAGESENPEKNVPKAIKSVGLRILLFYVLAMVVLACILPWKESNTSQSPFALVFKIANIPYASEIMNFVVLTSCLSSINSALYACSRLLWSMGNERVAPKFFTNTNKQGVPYIGVLGTLLITGLALTTAFISPNKVFLWLMSATGLIGCLIWIIISWCQINFHRKIENFGRKITDLKFRDKFYPFTPILGLILNTAVIIGMFCDPTQKVAFYTVLTCLVIIVIYQYIHNICKNSVVKENNMLPNKV